MNSMTGYGSSLFKRPQLELEIHVKSVNGRYLDVRFHLPKEYAPFESELKNCFDSQWNRGTVDVYVHRRSIPDAKALGSSIRVDQAVQWAKTLRALNKKLGLDHDISLRDVLQMPFVMESPEKGVVKPDEQKLLKGQVKKAVAACQVFRKREGASLRKELLGLLEDLSRCVQTLSKWRGQAQAQMQSRLQTRLATLGAESLDPARLAMESALLVDKMDVQEELVRLEEHILSCRKLVQVGGAQGKKLDFFCQELLREVNTVGSKSAMASLTQTVVEAKSLIERFREQVQNVE